MARERVSRVTPVKTAGQTLCCCWSGFATFLCGVAVAIALLAVAHYGGYVTVNTKAGADRNSLIQHLSWNTKTTGTHDSNMEPSSPANGPYLSLSKDDWTVPRAEEICWALQSDLHNKAQRLLSLNTIVERDFNTTLTEDVLYRTFVRADGSDSSPMRGDLYMVPTDSEIACVSLCLYELVHGGRGCMTAVYHAHRNVCYLKTATFSAAPVDNNQTVSFYISPKVVHPVKCADVKPSPLAAGVNLESFAVAKDTDSPGANLFILSMASESLCRLFCAAIDRCAVVIYTERSCFLKEVAFFATNSTGHVSWYRRAAPLTVQDPPFDPLFGVLAGEKYFQSRLVPALSTWLFDADSICFVEPADVGAAKEAIQPLVTRGVRTKVAPLGDFDGTAKGAWKDLPIALHLFTQYPNRSWYAIVDDDSYLIPQNLQLLLGRFPANDPVPRYLGARFSDGGEPPIPFIQGGAGIVINRAAAARILPKLTDGTCLRECKQWAGDIRLGCCFQLLSPRIEPLAFYEFWSQSVWKSTIRDRRNKMTAFPVSFHQMRNGTWAYDLFTAIQRTLYPKTNSDIWEGRGCMGWEAVRGGENASEYGINATLDRCTVRPGHGSITWKELNQVVITEWKGSRYPHERYDNLSDLV